MGLLSSNPMWDAFSERALFAVTSGGSDLGECAATTARVGDGTADDWYREWTGTAARLTEVGDDCAAKGHAVSAREAYFRASTYERVSYLPLFGAPVDPRLTAAFEREQDVFAKAAALSDPVLEPVEIPYEGTTLPAYLCRVDDAVRPIVVHTNGYDSNVHEMWFASGPAALRRGYHCLVFDGPGQGRNLVRDGRPMRPDWEAVVTPVIDWVVAQPFVDPAKVVLIGWSFGGLLAPRAAAFEHRLAALVADPGQWDVRSNLVARLPLSEADKAAFPDVDPHALDPMEEFLRSKDADPLLRWRLLQRGPWVHGTSSLYETLAAMCQFSTSEVAGEIRCPTLLTTADADMVGADAPKLFDALTVKNKALVHFTANEGATGHCETMARLLYHQRAYDWLDETLA